MSGTKLLDHWSPPDGAGAAVACLATSYTFESDFFTQDCLSRFLSLSTVASETSSIAALLEEEDRLSEAQVSVLVDRSTPADKRNLRWDVLPVLVRHGLLHAKVAALVWEHKARLVIGSANLTSAGYRRNIEIALSIDLDDECLVPMPFLRDVIAELRHLVESVPGAPIGAKGRAVNTLDLLEFRLGELDLPSAAGGSLRLAVAPARPGVSPFERLPDVWHGARPLRATWVSPYWDDTIRGPATEEVRRHLTGRPARRRNLTLVAAVDPRTGAIKAPQSLGLSGDEVVVFDPTDGDEHRTLHAKLLILESDDWVAALVGSSNATQAGFGLSVSRGHWELNVWLGCPSNSKTAKGLRSLARVGDRIGPEDERWEMQVDEDEPPARTAPPLGFVSCVVDASDPPRVLLEFAPDDMPDKWELRAPTGALILTSASWSSGEAPTTVEVKLGDGPLPAFLIVRWHENGEELQATWIANVADRSSLPPPAELRELPVDVIIDALASTRPLPVALEHEVRRRRLARSGDGAVDLDPLRRFDDSGLLLHRSRHFSLALWRLKERLARPAASLDAVPGDGQHAIPDRYVGRYEREGLVIDVAADDGATLRATVNPTHAVAESQDWPPMVNLPLQPVAREDSFLLKLPIADADLLAVFFNPDQPGAQPSYVHYGGRAHRRVNL